MAHPRPDRKRPLTTPDIRAGGGTFCAMATSRKRNTAQTTDEQTADEQTADEQTTVDEQTADEQTAADEQVDGESAGYSEPFTDDEIAEQLSTLTRDDLVRMQADSYKLAILISAELHSRDIDHTEGL